jgi:hypothetical protein
MFTPHMHTHINTHIHIYIWKLTSLYYLDLGNRDVKYFDLTSNSFKRHYVSLMIVLLFVPILLKVHPCIHVYKKCCEPDKTECSPDANNILGTISLFVPFWNRNINKGHKSVKINELHVQCRLTWHVTVF